MISKDKSQNCEDYFPGFTHFLEAFDNVVQRSSMLQRRTGMGSFAFIF